MKKLALVLTMMLVLLIGTGCQSPQEPTHKDTLILVSNIAVNHLLFERDMALAECEEDDILPEACDDAIEFEKWADMVSAFEQHIEDSNDLSIGAEEIDLIADLIIAEMGDDVDPRTKLYIMDIKEVLKMMIRDEEVRMTMRAPKEKK